MKKLLALCLFAASCSSFVTTEDDARLAELEQYTYVMLKDVSVEQKSLAKKQAVKIMIARGEDTVKVYAYTASVDILKSERVLILYMFSDDFPAGKFDFDVFSGSLNEFIVRK
ncbi:MAG: hypothetical protein FWG13_07340 [Leptospirales bacterium]|nr:hypothetical protein [Leptospirales bacterium]